MFFWRQGGEHGGQYGLVIAALRFQHLPVLLGEGVIRAIIAQFMAAVTLNRRFRQLIIERIACGGMFLCFAALTVGAVFRQRVGHEKFWRMAAVNHQFFEKGRHLRRIITRFLQYFDRDIIGLLFMRARVFQFLFLNIGLRSGNGRLGAAGTVCRNGNGNARQ